MSRPVSPPGGDAPRVSLAESHHAIPGSLPALALAALGIVYGDIGTSPLYAIKECFHGPHAVEITALNIYGVLSLVFWSLTVVISVKYVLFIMRADNKGEGGIFALLALLAGQKGRASRWIPLLAVFGAALLYGDGVITPAISVLSAVEGLNVATTAAADYVVPLTCLVLFGLFFCQKHGTDAIGKVFGPIMILWFVSLAALGLRELGEVPEILAALNPAHAVRFFLHNHLHGVVVLGSVVLCITGGEALYADMGHLGSQPIRLSWYLLVFPALLLNYFGQGALLLKHPELASNPFYGLVPRDLLYAMVGLATAATVIASQALISGVFSLTQQAIQLGFSPRMQIVHTSDKAQGQIYLPGVNWALMLSCLALVLVFGESSRLAGAYGIAVTATMAITSLLYYQVTRSLWHWPRWASLSLLCLFLLFDVSFLGANLLKVLDGGWITLLIALGIMLLMTTWRDGRAALFRAAQLSRIPVDIFLKDLSQYKPVRTPGTAVFMALSPEGVPLSLLQYFKHSESLHRRIVFLTVRSADTPTVPAAERLEIAELGQGFFRLVARYGFMQTPNVQEILEQAAAQGLELDIHATSFILGREALLTTGDAAMSGWRKRLFALMSRNAWNATSFFGLPPGRVMELGAQVQI
jgi:KUP system potassium uptake protein